MARCAKKSTPSKAALKRLERETLDKSVRSAIKADMSESSYSLGQYKWRIVDDIKSTLRPNSTQKGQIRLFLPHGVFGQLFMQPGREYSVAKRADRVYIRFGITSSDMLSDVLGAQWDKLARRIKLTGNSKVLGRVAWNIALRYPTTDDILRERDLRAWNGYSMKNMLASPVACYCLNTGIFTMKYQYDVENIEYPETITFAQLFTVPQS